MKSWVKMLFVCGLGLGAVSGCGVKEYLNCRTICEKKKTCGTNSSYNVDNCVSSCSDRANSNTDYARQVNTCKECVDPLSCTDPTLVTCFGNCPDLPSS